MFESQVSVGLRPACRGLTVCNSVFTKSINYLDTSFRYCKYVCIIMSFNTFILITYLRVVLNIRVVVLKVSGLFLGLGDVK